MLLADVFINYTKITEKNITDEQEAMLTVEPHNNFSKLLNSTELMQTIHCTLRHTVPAIVIKADHFVN